MATVGAIARDSQSELFFDATERGELLVRKCDDCGHFNELSHPLCTGCGSSDLTWIKAAGTGTIVSWTIIPPARNAEEGTPSTLVALIELAEGPWLWAQLPDIDMSKLAVGAAMSVGFVRPEGGETLPVFFLVS